MKCHFVTLKLDRLEKIINFCHLYITFAGKRSPRYFFAKLQPILQALIQVKIPSNREASTVPLRKNQRVRRIRLDSDCDEPGPAIETACI